jgi:hypothetical protein
MVIRTNIGTIPHWIIPNFFRKICKDFLIELRETLTNYQCIRSHILIPLHRRHPYANIELKVCRGIDEGCPQYATAAVGVVKEGPADGWVRYG